MKEQAVVEMHKHAVGKAKKAEQFLKNYHKRQRCLVSKRRDNSKKCEKEASSVDRNYDDTKLSDPKAYTIS